MPDNIVYCSHRNCPNEYRARCPSAHGLDVAHMHTGMDEDWEGDTIVGRGWCYKRDKEIIIECKKDENYAFHKE